MFKMKRNTSLKPVGVQGLINTYESCRNQREKVVGRWCDAQRVGRGLLRPSCWLYFCDKTSGISNNNKSRGEGGGGLEKTPSCWCLNCREPALEYTEEGQAWRHRKATHPQKAETSGHLRKHSTRARCERE